MFAEELIRSTVYATIDQISRGDYNPAMAQTAHLKKQIIARLEDVFRRHLPKELHVADWKYVLEGKYEDPEDLITKLVYTRRPVEPAEMPRTAILFCLFFLVAGFLYLIASCHAENVRMRQEIADFLQKVNATAK